MRVTRDHPDLNYSETAQAQNLTSITSPTGVTSPSFPLSPLKDSKVSRFQFIPTRAAPPPPSGGTKRNPKNLNVTSPARVSRSAASPKTRKAVQSPRISKTPRTPRSTLMPVMNLVPILRNPKKPNKNKKKVGFLDLTTGKRKIDDDKTLPQSPYPFSEMQMQERKTGGKQMRGDDVKKNRKAGVNKLDGIAEEDEGDVEMGGI